MASPTIHPLHSALREATNTAHDALERLPYSEQLAKATLSKEDLARSLHDWRTLYAAVEARSGDLPTVWREWMARTDAVDADLKHLPAVEWSGSAAADAADYVANCSEAELAGMLYVLEGSAMGGMTLRKSVQQIGGEALGAFHAPYGKETRAKFVGFLERLGEAELDEKSVLAGAVAGFEHMEKMTAQWQW